MDFLWKRSQIAFPLGADHGCTMLAAGLLGQHGLFFKKIQNSRRRFTRVSRVNHVNKVIQPLWGWPQKQETEYSRERQVFLADTIIFTRFVLIVKSSLYSYIFGFRWGQSYLAILVTLQNCTKMLRNLIFVLRFAYYASIQTVANSFVRSFLHAH